MNCDCHIHLYEDHYPLAASAMFKPGAYQPSRSGQLHLDDVSPHAKALAQTYPDRCLWASNRPHPNRNPMPSNALMLSLLEEWAPDAAVREKILVHNPAQVFGF